MDAYHLALGRWERAVDDEWQRLQIGQSHNGERAHGPWHAKLNDTMFWM